MKTDEEDICSVCLEPKVKPITLPCGHSFCAACVDGWRDQYGLTEEEKNHGSAYGIDVTTKYRTCPNCRSPIPPTRNMLSSLHAFTRQIRDLERQGDFESRAYQLLEAKLISLNNQIGEDWDGITVLDDGQEEPVDLPVPIGKCIERNDIPKMLAWFGDPKTPEFKRRLNAQVSICGNMTLLQICGEENNTDIASILLQLGADVDIKDSQAATYLVRTIAYGQGEFETCGKLALEWGAATTGHPLDVITILHDTGTESGLFQSALMRSEFGGRRCEVVGHERSELNGCTCVADVHLPETDEYKVRMEHTPEELVIGHMNLKRRDRTPQDPGHYIEFKDGKVTRREFKSNEECMAFVAKVAETNWVVEEAARYEAAEAAKAEAAKAEAAKAEAAAVEAAPVETSPVEAAPVEAVPVEAVPVEAAAANPDAEPQNNADQTVAESSQI